MIENERCHSLEKFKSTEMFFDQRFDDVLNDRLN